MVSENKVKLNRSGTTGSVSLIVIGIILILAAIVFYFVKNTNWFVITIGVIGLVTIILGIAILLYAQSYELKSQKEKLLPQEESKKVEIPRCGGMTPSETPTKVFGVVPNKGFNFHQL